MLTLFLIFVHINDFGTNSVSCCKLGCRSVTLDNFEFGNLEGGAVATQADNSQGLRMGGTRGVSRRLTTRV